VRAGAARGQALGCLWRSSTRDSARSTRCISCSVRKPAGSASRLRSTVAIWSHMTRVRRSWISTGGRTLVSRALVLVNATTAVLSVSQSGCRTTAHRRPCCSWPCRGQAAGTPRPSRWCLQRSQVLLDGVDLGAVFRVVLDRTSLGCCDPATFVAVHRLQRGPDDLVGALPTRCAELQEQVSGAPLELNGGRISHVLSQPLSDRRGPRSAETVPLELDRPLPTGVAVRRPTSNGMHFALEVRTPSAVRKPQRWRIVRPRLDASAVGADTRFSLGAQQHRA